MPTIDWNKRWGAQVTEHVRAGDDYFWGNQWGPPQERPALQAVIDRYITPFIHADTVVLEIGPGGGRWTQFLVGARELVLVDLNPEFFDYLRERFPAERARLRFYATRGAELDGIDDRSIDFVFSFGALVHVDPADIEAYLGHLHRVMKPGARAALQYADKTKPAARDNDSFSHMDAPTMEAFARRADFAIEVHDTTLITHSNIVVLRR